MGSCGREGTERYFYPTFQPCFPRVSDNHMRAVHLSRQGPHQKRKAKSQGTGGLKPYGTRQPSALSRRNRRETSSPACTGKCVIPFSEEQKFTPTCVAWEACGFLGGKGMVTWGTRNGEELSAIFFFVLFCFLSHPNISVPCKRRSGVVALPWMVFISHRSTTVFLIKPSRA